MRGRGLPWCIVLATIWVMTMAPAHAQLPLGHYLPGLFSDDAMGGLPPVSGIFANEFFLDYTAHTINGPDGRRLTTGGIVTLPTGQKARVKADLNSFTAMTYIIGMTDIKIFGARYGAGMGIPLANQGVSSALQTFGNTMRVDNGSVGFGDITVNPIMLGWQGSRGSAWFDYAITLPCGRFSGNATNNVGLGFYSQLLQVGGMVPLDKDKSVRLSGLLSYEINGSQAQTGVYVGNHLTFEYGLKKQFSPTFSAGLTGYGQWQMTPTTGVPIAGSSTFRDSVIGVGGEVQFVLPKAQGTTIVFRAIRELDSTSRFQGSFFNLTLQVPIATYPDVTPADSTPKTKPEATPQPDKSTPAPPR